MNESYLWDYLESKGGYFRDLKMLDWSEFWHEMEFTPMFKERGFNEETTYTGKIWVASEGSQYDP